MKILQITSVVLSGEGGLTTVFGLGDDNKVYEWDEYKKGWKLK